MAVCDKDRGVVLEVTPKQVVVRPSSEGVCICTNHFRTDELGGPESCWRYEKLAAHFLAMITLAMVQRCLRILDPANTT